jgi:hypothetical protein
MQEEGMHNRLRAGWRCLTLAAAAAAVFALPALDVFAAGFGPVRPGDRIETVASPEPTSKKPLLYPRSNYLWPFEAGPVYGEVAESRRNEAGVLHTAVGSFDLALGWPTFPAALRGNVKFDRLPAQYFVLQVHPEAFADGTFDAIRSAIDASGGAIVQEMPVAAFVVRLSASGLAAVQGSPSVLTVEPYHPALKLSPTIGRIPLADPVKAISEQYSLEVQLFRGEDANAAAAAVQALGAAVTLVTSDTIYVEANRMQLASIAALEPVSMIHERVPVFLHGEETTTTMQTGNYNAGAIPYTDAGVDGSGGGKAGTSAQILAVVDSGIQLDAGDLSDTRTSAGAAGAGHRKVLHYAATDAFGGNGDLLGCDASQSGGFTHGHTVSAGALGNGTDVPLAYGDGWTITDAGGNPWKLDGVAPGAKLVAYDAQDTPASGLGCDDPGQGGIITGDLYSAPSGGVLGDAYTRGAKVGNFSFGATQSNTYGTDAIDVDQFLFDKKDAMVFISAGNSAQDTNQDGFPDASSVSTPATAKNASVIGASFSANPSGSGPNARAGFSSVGPVLGGRIAPLLMAPGADAGGLGEASEYNCRSLDNDQANPVECDEANGLSGTSFSSPAAAGAALVVRDYFAQGFYPDGTDTNPGNGTDQVTYMTGALLKSILIASADWMNNVASLENPNGPGANMRFTYRFNNEQGYGRVQLNNVLPLDTYPSALGLIVCDANPGRCDTSGITGTVPASTTQTYNLVVTDNGEPLKIALSWMDPPAAAGSGALSRNLNLEVVSPSGRVYYGNYFTDDDDKSGLIGTGEGCDYVAGTPWPGAGQGSSGLLDTGPWSIPTCANSDRDTANPTEAVFLSNDAAGNGTVDNPGTAINETADNQIEIGTWQVKVINTNANATDIGLAIAGPVQLGSSVRIQRVRPDDSLASGAFVCNDQARLIVNEISEAGDASVNNNAAEISSRVTLEVVDAGTDGIFGTGDDTIEDTESSISFIDLDGAGAGLRYESSDLFLTDGTSPDPGNGALDIRSGQRVRVTYQDELNGSPDTNKKRVSEAAVECRTQIVSGGVVWGQFGRDATTFINGGCEKDLRGYFTFGFPDKYMDAGELIGYRIAFQSQESENLEDAEVTLKAVAVDADSPVDCKPNTAGVCADPDRLNNSVSPYLTILEPDQTLGRIGANSAVSANFTVQMGSSIPANTEIEMVLGVSARKSGKPVQSYVVSRHRLDVDEVSFFYSTDFPNSGAENRDINNNETIEAITTSTGDFDLDYYVESRSFSSLKANGRNPNIGSPWNFDTGRQGWNVGVNNVSRLTLLPAQWGEDKNFNGLLDSGEDRDPANGVLDYGWGTRGGCGWQTNSAAPGTPGGVWHTGRVDVTTATTCLANGATAAQCQRFETVAGFFGENIWWELLVSPEFEKVNQCPTGAEPGCGGQADQTGKPVYQVEFTNWAWNMSLDLPDSISGIVYELDTDTEKIQPIDLFNDNSILNAVFGPQGAVTGGNAPITDGFNLFANVSKCIDTDGNGVLDRCGNANGPACTSDTNCTGLSFNGSVGNNRSGKNACFFEGKTSGVIRAKQPYGLSLPADDDVANGYCQRTDDLNGIDRSRSCRVATQATDCSPGVGPFNGVCQTADAVADEYVTANGPIRNYDIGDANGPDMRFSTLEDFYGDSGRKFQAAMGFYTQEGTPSGPVTAGFGVAIDDQVVEWREFRLDADATNCNTAGAAECAAIELAQTNVFEGSTVLQVTVLERSPKNDCNLDGDVIDANDDDDCDDNGTRDLKVRAFSEGEPEGELFQANEVSPGAGRFTINIPTSFSYDSPGTLFVTPASAVARIQYKDWDDGTGSVCRNATDPSQRGTLEESTTLFVAAGRVALKGVRVVDITGDGDGFADDGEEIELYLTLTNKSGADLEDVSVSIQSADTTSESRIACISRPSVSLGALANRASAETPTPLKFTVGSVGRQVGEEDLAKLITFNVTVRSDRFDALTRTVQFSIDTDLNASGGSGPGTFVEDFEVTSGFNQFTTMSIDAGRESLAGSNGYRCQYNDPDYVNSNSFGSTECYMGVGGNAYDWHLHNTSSGDGGRAFTGTRSLHWGVHQSAGPSRDTTRLAQLDAIRTTNPINLGVGAVNPELSFKHQISLADNRISNTPNGEAADRAVVHVQLADGASNAIGDWVKVYPYENEYDARGTDQFTNCTFDPVDDGNNEDSWFDPTDPFRRKGPSSTCDPEFTFVFHGDTDYRSNPPDLTRIGRAFDGPGLQGALGAGTWVQPKFALNQYKGRRLRVRFVATSIEVSTTGLMDAILGGENEVGDDGWYIDDVRVTDTLTSPATLSADTVPRSPTGCVDCTTVTASLSSTPAGSPAPGQPVTLSASGSSADSCLNGALQFRFFKDANLNGQYNEGIDPILRDWTDNSGLLDAPLVDTTYGVSVRCSSDITCESTTTTFVDVACPSTGTQVSFFNGSINVKKTAPEVTWSVSQGFDAVQINGNTLRSSAGNFTTAAESCVANDASGTSFSWNPAVNPGEWKAILLRPGGGSFCNAQGSYSSQAPTEAAGRDSEIGSLCP